VRVIADVDAIDREFDYLVDADAEIEIGMMVRIRLHNRPVAAWISAVDVTPPKGVKVQPLTKISGYGPPAEVVELARWAAWRWAGPVPALLRTASPPTLVRGLPLPPRHFPVPAVVADEADQELFRTALDLPLSILRLPPTFDVTPLLLMAAQRGPIIIATATNGAARTLGMRLRRAGVPIAIGADEWRMARAGWASIIGTRSVAFAPLAKPAAIIILEEHVESYQQEQTPTWNARDVLIERARRLQIPCIATSSIPSLEILEQAPLLTVTRNQEREGWPIMQVIDRNGEPPGQGLFSERLVQVLRSERRALCILNRKGRSRLLGCANCGVVAACESCGAAVTQQDDGQLLCSQCKTLRPVVCLQCHSTKMKNLRRGVTRAREELEALLREPVGEVSDKGDLASERVIIGTEAALYRINGTDLVVFLDFDQELFAPRSRAAMEAFALLVRAAKLVGGRARGGEVVVQTQAPQHEVIQSALRADPMLAIEKERQRRQLLGLAPYAAIALISGQAAEQWVDRYTPSLGVQLLGPSDGKWLLKAPDHETLSREIAGVARPAGRLRIEVDPLRF